MEIITNSIECFHSEYVKKFNMKKLVYLASILVLTSACNKEVLPDPQMLNTQAQSSFFVAGIGNTISVDGIDYEAECGVIPASIILPNQWKFEVYSIQNNESIFEVVVLDTMVNNDPSYNTIRAITDGSAVQLLQDTDTVAHGKLVLSYKNELNQEFTSIIMGSANSSALEITSKSDTIIDGKQFRLVQFSGPVTFQNTWDLSTTIHPNFNTSIAFSL